MSKAADDKERLARSFDNWSREADQLSHRASKSKPSGGGGVGRGGHEVWSGPAAGRFMAELQQLKGELGKLPGGLSRTARNLRESAQELRAQEKAQEREKK